MTRDFSTYDPLVVSDRRDPDARFIWELAEGYSGTTRERLRRIADRLDPPVEKPAAVERCEHGFATAHSGTLAGIGWYCAGPGRDGMSARDRFADIERRLARLEAK